MRAEIQILLDVASYRLRRLEMANLAGALALALVLGLSTGAVAVRLAFGFALNLLVYLNNDFCDGAADLDADGRERGKTEYLLSHRAAALRVLQSRLLDLRRKQEKEAMDALKGDASGSWGDQMRSYVLHPYQMVKDLRTGTETGNTSSVLDGELDEFIESGIRWRLTPA